jgi:hypothetical protein
MRSHATESSQKPNPRNTKHGLTLMKRALREHGTRVIEGRTSLGKALDRWRDQLVRDLGGPEQVSTQQLAIISLAVRTKLLLESVDAWLLQQPTLVNARKRALLPIVLQRQQLADALARYMNQLGIERKAKQLPSLAEYLNGAKATKDGSGESNATKPAPCSPSAVTAQVHTADGAAPAPQEGEA